MGFKLRHMFLKASLSLLPGAAHNHRTTSGADAEYRRTVPARHRKQPAYAGIPYRGDPGRRTRKKRPQRKAARPECRIVRRLSRAARRFPARIDPSHAPRHPELVETTTTSTFPNLFTKEGKSGCSIRQADLERQIASLSTENDRAEIKMLLLQQYVALYNLYRAD